MNFCIVRFDTRAYDVRRKTEEGIIEVGAEGPTVVETFFSPDEAEKKCKELNDAARSDVVEMDMTNGSHYKGPKYFYKVLEG